MAQLVEHIVHIDGVTGSSPVATTKDASKEASFPFILNEALSRSEADHHRQKKPEGFILPADYRIPY